MPIRKLKDGRRVRVPEGLSTAGEQDFVLANVPGATPETVGLESVRQRSGPVEAAFVNAGNFLTSLRVGPHRLGENVGTAGLDRLRDLHPVASFIGGAAVPVSAGIAASFVPGAQAGLPAVAAQATTAAGLEALREGSSPESITRAGVIGGGSQLGANVAGRVVSGIQNIRQARRLGQPLGIDPALRGTTAQNVVRGLEGSGGLNAVIRTNLRAINTRVAQALGFTDEAAIGIRELDDAFLLTARNNVDEAYRAAGPVRDVDVTRAREILERMPDGADAEVAELLASIDGLDAVPAASWQGLNRSLRDISARVGRNPLWSSHARTSEAALDALDIAAEAAGGSRAALGRANQQFKLLATLEEINAVVEGNVAPAGELLRKLGRPGFRGFGRRTIAEGNQRLTPEIQSLIDDAKTVARFTRETAGGSATAGRQASFTAPASGVADIVTGDAPLRGLMKIGLFPATRVSGVAAVGRSGPARVGTLGQALATDEDEQ